MFAVVELCKQQDGKAPDIPTIVSVCPNRKGCNQMSKPEYNFTFTVGANQIATKRYTRKELAQDLKGFRAQPTRYSVCKNENAIVVEMLPVMADRAIAIYVRCYA
jgi:hypothetical protein